MNLKDRVCATIDENQEYIIRIAKKILENPELGYKEVKTSNLIMKQWQEWKLEYQSQLAITGVKAKARGRNSKLNVCIIGEMDAVVSPQHPFADPCTGAAHACGHNTQIASMLGCALGLIQSDVMQELDGDVTFFAVPAEEFIEMEHR